MVSDREAEKIETIFSIFDSMSKILPQQGPIGVFVHHNTLHSFEHLPFEEAVEQAGQLYGAQPYMSLPFYQTALESGRISPGDLEQVLLEETGGSERLLAGRVESHALKMFLLQDLPAWPEDPSVQFWLHEERGLHRFPAHVPESVRRSLVLETITWLNVKLREGKSWAALFEEVEGEFSTWGKKPARELERWILSHPEQAALASVWSAAARRSQGYSLIKLEEKKSPAVSLRDTIHREYFLDTDGMVHEILIPLLSAYLDQGLAYWPLSVGQEGLYATLRQVLVDFPLSGSGMQKILRSLALEDKKRGRNAEQSLLNSLAELGYSTEQWEAYLRERALALPGFTGLIAKLQREPELAPKKCPPVALLDLFALRLLMERAALLTVFQDTEAGKIEWAQWLAQQKQSAKRGAANSPFGSLVQNKNRSTFLLFQVAVHFGLSPSFLLQLREEEFSRFFAVVGEMQDLSRRRLLHLAYERTFHQARLRSLAAFRKQVGNEPPPAAKFQLVLCMDDRCESLRRHLEELSPEVETFGTAGFFGVAVAFRGLDDRYHVDLCPVVQKPVHAVLERVPAGQSAPLQKYLNRKKIFSTLLYQNYVGSRGLVRGWVATFGFGLLSALPFSFRLFYPRLTQKFSNFFSDLFFHRPDTELSVERREEEKGSLNLFPGFTSEEMAERVRLVLSDIGLIKKFSRLVIILGHGSSSLNNPLASAYDCGACGGRRGGPNARLFARMANNPQVRQILKQQGIVIPTETVFVGGYHDTSSQAISWFDRNLLPPTHEEEFAQLQTLLEQARMVDAHERCRRFMSVPLEVSAPQALSHVEGRAADLSQPRPELGHATNALAVFGRREMTRGLFLDRRAFLISYDPLTDDEEGEIVGRLLSSMGPVGAGINLEYYFSRVDNEKYGCGTKLPHNVVSLLGIMNGPLSDLRTGLPLQMVEIHEPMRLLVVVESTREVMDRVMNRIPAVARLIKNRWIFLALMHPDTGELSEWKQGDYLPLREEEELPEVEKSPDWYMGRRGDLPPALLRSALRQERRPLS